VALGDDESERKAVGVRRLCVFLAGGQRNLGCESGSGDCLAVYTTFPGSWFSVFPRLPSSSFLERIDGIMSGLCGFTRLLVAWSREGRSRFGALKRLGLRLQTYHFPGRTCCLENLRIRGCPPESWRDLTGFIMLRDGGAHEPPATRLSCTL
jgi:hypothetical protein